MAAQAAATARTKSGTTAAVHRPTSAAPAGSIEVRDGAIELFAVPPQLDRLIGSLGSNTVAALLGVSKSQPSRWRSRAEGIGPANRRRIADLDHVMDRLLLELHPEQAGTWLASANAHLGGARPVDVLLLRGAGPVIDAIDALAEGAYA